LEDERWSAGALQQRGWRVTKDPGRPDSGVRALALQRVLDAPAAPLGVAVVDAACRLAPEFVEASATALQRNARVGLVSSWSADGGAWQRTTVTPCPALPYQWVMNDLGGCCTIRTTALREVGWMPEVIGGDVSPADWALAILAGGWRAVTYPALLSWRVNGAVADSVARRQSTGARVRAALIDRWPELGVELADWQPFLESHVTRASRSVRSERGSFTPETVLREPFRAQMRLLGRALRNPHYAAAWVGWHSRRAWRGALRRLRGSRAEP
jgi:hypothetical protein